MCASFGDDMVVLNLVQVSLGLLMRSLSRMPSLPSARSRKVCIHSLFSVLAFNPVVALWKDCNDRRNSPIVILDPTFSFLFQLFG